MHILWTFRSINERQSFGIAWISRSKVGSTDLESFTYPTEVVSGSQEVWRRKGRKDNTGKIRKRPIRIKLRCGSTVSWNNTKVKHFRFKSWLKLANRDPDRSLPSKPDCTTIVSGVITSKSIKLC